MPSLRRRRDRMRCASKVAHPTEQAAWAAARQLRKDKGVNARVYRCPGRHGEPRHWHVTSGRW